MLSRLWSATKQLALYPVHSLFGASTDGPTVHAPMPIASFQGTRQETDAWMAGPESAASGLVPGVRYLLVDLQKQPNVVACQVSSRGEGLDTTLVETKFRATVRMGPIAGELDQFLRRYCDRGRTIAVVILVVPVEPALQEYARNLLAELQRIVPAVNSV